MELIFVAYLFSGIFKYFLDFWNIGTGVDITLLFGVLSLFGACTIFFRGGSRLDTNTWIWVTVFLTFYAWMLSGVPFSYSTGYAKVKPVLFITNIIAFLVPILHGKLRPKRVVLYFSLLSITAGIIYYWLLPHAYLELSSEARRKFVGLYLSLGLFNGMSLLLLIGLKREMKSASRLMLGFACMAILALSGARGAIIFAASMLLVHVLMKLNGFMKSLMVRFKSGSVLRGAVYFSLISGAVGLSVFFLYEALWDQLNRTIARLSLLMNLVGGGELESAGHSIESRQTDIVTAFNLIFESLPNFIFGYGIGSYSILRTGVDGTSHPHNMLLEVWVELGLVGIILIIWLLLWPFIVGIRCHRNPYFLAAGFLFLNAMKSHSLVDLRIFFGVLALFYVWGVSGKVLTHNDSLSPLSERQK